MKKAPLLKENQETARQRVIVALDFPGKEPAEAFLERWKDREGAKPFVKVGMQLFYAAGPSWVVSLKERGFPVFLDLKLHDIPNTVEGAVQSISRLGVDLVTLHASGGSRMMKAAREAAEQAGVKRPRLLAVTQLTSTDQVMLNEEIGIPGTVKESVLRYARLAQASGVDGVVCSGEEAGEIKQATSGVFLTVTPGIRPKGSAVGDQKRVMTPAQAIANGADYLVVGRPVTQAPDPVSAYKAIIQEIIEAEVE
jgi:orotidine-5'-phosphate decarboxylase